MTDNTQKAQGSGAAWRNVYRVIREATAVEPPEDENARLAFAEQLTGLVLAAALSQPPEASEGTLREAAASIADGQRMSGNDQWSAGYDAAARKIARAIRSLPLS